MSKVQRILAFLTLYLAFAMIQSGVIIPDPQNPFLVHRSNIISTGITNTLYFNFQLPAGSAGLGYKQIIGATLWGDSTLATNLATGTTGAAGGTTDRWTCALFDVTTAGTPVAISVAAVFSHTTEGSTFLCRVEDLVNSLVAGNRYGLRIAMINPAGFLSANNVVRQVSLWTSTGTINPTERIIIDSNPVFANMGLYPDFVAFTTAPLAFATTTSAITVGNGAAVTLVFDVIVNSVFRGSEVNVYLEWDSAILTAGSLTATNGDITGATATETLKKAYANSLTITPITGTNMAQITGILDDLVATRTWKISITGFTTKNVSTNAAVNSNVTLWAFYRNSYSVISRSQFALVTVSAFSFSSFTAAPYDNWTSIRQGGSWNIQFTFTPAVAYTDPGYIVVRQINAELNKSKVNFIASTCDFSGMPTIIASAAWGVRPIC
jgi:hypothetical protein